MCKEKRQKTELEQTIYNDIQSEIWKYYDSNGIEYKGKRKSEEPEEPQETIIDFFSYLFRLIPKTKRNVYYSKELSEKIYKNEISKDKVDILKAYEGAFSEGKDMNCFLSNNIKKSREPDFLLYTWHLYHLHMSGKFVEDNKQMKNNRSDTLLLCIIDSNYVFFIDVIPHPQKSEDFFNIHYLESIINNGWIEKIGFFEVTDYIPGTMNPKITENKDIFEIYSRCSANIAFELQGKCYLSLEQMNSTRRPYDAMSELIKINREIFKLNELNGTYKRFHLEKDKKGCILGIVEFKMPTGKTITKNIF